VQVWDLATQMFPARVLSGLVSFALLGLLGACDQSANEAAAPRTTSPEHGNRGVPVDDRSSLTVPADKVDRQLWDEDTRSASPRWSSQLPKVVPTDFAGAVSLDADPPGAARMVVQPNPFAPGRGDGWEDEEVFFYGVDARWRYLRMLDLGIADTRYGIPGSVGPYSLSYDGTKWAGIFQNRLVVVDLGTGRHRGFELPVHWATSAYWSADNRHVLTADRNRHGRYLSVDVKTGRIQEVPFDPFSTGFDNGGDVFELRLSGKGTHRSELVTHLSSGGTATTPLLPEMAFPWRPFIQRDYLATQRDRETHNPSWREDPQGVVVLDMASGEAVSLLALDAFDLAWVLVEGWVGNDTVLLSTRDHILAWHPLSGKPIQVATQFPLHGHPGPWRPRMLVDVAINLVRP
jgi:hypothetical protein